MAHAIIIHNSDAINDTIAAVKHIHLMMQMVPICALSTERHSTQRYTRLHESRFDVCYNTYVLELSTSTFVKRSESAHRVTNTKKSPTLLCLISLMI